MSHISKTFLHTKCRCTLVPYPRSTIFRQNVPDDKVKWSVDFPTYNPPDYTADYVQGKVWADPNDVRNCNFNALDNGINRISFALYKIDGNDRPLNPIGRTGLCGRGNLGRWGPNHAADPIVSRFSNGRLQFVGIQRGDTGEWAVPGGMVDKGEDSTQAAVREFTEEALDGNKNLSSELSDFWSNGVKLYQGYVDDHRNTDNAWMETCVINYHDRDGLFENIHLKAGDDAVNVRWVTIEQDLQLYASHSFFIKLLMKFHKLTF